MGVFAREASKENFFVFYASEARKEKLWSKENTWVFHASEGSKEKILVFYASEENIFGFSCERKSQTIKEKIWCMCERSDQRKI